MHDDHVVLKVLASSQVPCDTRRAMKTRTASPATISASDLAAARLAAKADASAPVRLLEGRTFAVTTDSDSFMLVTLGRDTGAELNPDRVAGAEHGGFMVRGSGATPSSNPDRVAGAVHGGVMTSKAPRAAR